MNLNPPVESFILVRIILNKTNYSGIWTLVIYFFFVYLNFELKNMSTKVILLFLTYVNYVNASLSIVDMLPVKNLIAFYNKF